MGFSSPKYIWARGNLEKIRGKSWGLDRFLGPALGTSVVGQQSYCVGVVLR